MRFSLSTQSRKNFTWELWEVGWGWGEHVAGLLSLLSQCFPPMCSLFHFLPAAHFWIFKYLRTVSCLQALWSLQREERTHIQINKFHLHGRLPCWGTRHCSSLLLVYCITAMVIQSRKCKIFNAFDQKCMKSYSQRIMCVCLKWTSGGN